MACPRGYGYARITAQMETALAQLVRGRAVYDIGAGQLELAVFLHRLGAARVTAVDRYEPCVDPAGLPLDFRKEYAAQGPRPTDRVDVLLLSWPENRYLDGVVEKWMPAAEHVVYIGCNDGCTACGWPGLFAATTRREVGVHIEHPRNDLLVVGPRQVNREPTSSELRGLKVGSAHRELIRVVDGCVG